MERAKEIALSRMIMVIPGFIVGICFGASLYFSDEAARLSRQTSLEGWRWPAYIAIAAVWGIAAAGYGCLLLKNSMRTRPWNLALIGLIPYVFLVFPKPFLLGSGSQSIQTQVTQYLVVGLIFLSIVFCILYAQRGPAKTRG